MPKYIAIVGLAVLLTVPAAAPAQDLIKEVDACGLVLDPSGHGVPDATVSAMSGGNVVETSTTLSDGSFSFLQNVNSEVQISVKARGFAPATGTVDHLHSAGSRKCKRPLYAVLAVVGGTSFLTEKKNKLPRSK